MNQTEIGSEFGLKIIEWFSENKPKNILETGTYQGNGSTRIIATAIQDIPCENATFYSIECNNENVAKAYENLGPDLNKLVTIMPGLSIPVDMIPSAKDINERIIKACAYKNIKMDHENDLANSASHYLNETAKYDRDDRIGDVMREFKNKVDFALLDSGGHIGNIEFRYFLSKLKSPCVIALDDINHFKHYESYKSIQDDRRFTILCEGDEKFGYVIAKYIP